MASRRIAGTFKFPFRTDLRRQQYPKSKCGLTTPETDVFQHTQAMAAARAYFFTLAYSADEVNFSGMGIMIYNGSWIDTQKFSNGLPGADKDFFQDAMWSRILGNSTFEVNNFSINAGCSIFTVSNGASGTNDDEGQIQASTFDMPAYVAPSIIAHGNFSVRSGTGDVYIGSANYRAGFNQITIGGDLDLGQARDVRFGWDPNTTYSKDHYALDVGGVVKMHKNDSQFLTINRFGGTESNTHYSSYTKEIYARFGGLDGQGVICNNDPGAIGTTIVFQAQDGKNFQGGDWTGKILSYYVGGHTEMKFVMDDRSSGGSAQILRINDGHTNANNTNIPALNFEIINGTLGLANTYAFKAGNIILAGGTLEIYSMVIGDDMGYGEIYAENMEITGGEIIFNASNKYSQTSDHIEVDNISGQNGTFVINLDSESFSWGDTIDLQDLSLFRSISGNGYDWKSSTLKVVFKGVDITKFLDNVALRTDTSSAMADISGTIVPEPATLAAILGLISLSFAAFRRRK